MTPKNLKVFTGMSRPELMRNMQLIRASLGVRCEYCHVETEDGFDFASDAKEQKVEAREMIEMTKKINEIGFKGRPLGAGCYTCHQGHERPNSLVPLPQVVPPPAPKQAAAPAPAPGTTAATAAPVGPSAESLVNAYLKASMPSASNRVLRGTATTQRGAATFEVMESGGKVLLRSKTQMGEMVQMYDGTKGWARDQRGTHELRPDEIARFQEMSRSFELPVLDPKIKWRGPRADKIDDREVWRIENRVSPEYSERYWFDKQSGLLVRSMRIGTIAAGRIPEQVDYSDYRAVNGVQFPFNIRQSMVDVRASAERKFEAVEMPAKVDASAFEMK
jgi:hypothetical protein